MLFRRAISNLAGRRKFVRIGIHTPTGPAGQVGSRAADDVQHSSIRYFDVPYAQATGSVGLLTPLLLATTDDF